jgi:hypothetical protein
LLIDVLFKDEFEAMLDGHSVAVVMTALLGHLMELELDPLYKKWNKGSLNGTPTV